MEIDFGVAYVKQNTDTRVKVTMSEFRNKLYIHIREYGFDGDTGNLFPTAKGITLEPENVDRIIEMLEQVSNVLAEPYKDNKQEEFCFTKEK